jgi:hypothetical protein
MDRVNRIDKMKEHDFVRPVNPVNIPASDYRAVTK